LKWKRTGIHAIELWGSAQASAGQDAVTLAGIHIGSTDQQVMSTYRIVRTARACHSIGPGLTIDYYAYSGDNTLLFMAYSDRVVRIALVAGHDLTDC
jgi:hypothetical protein